MIRPFHLPYLVPLTTCRRGAPFLPPNQFPISNLASNSRPNPTQTTTTPILPALSLTPLPLHQSLSHHPNTIQFA
jgi:hypothetical protein